LGRVAISRHGNARASAHYTWNSPTQLPTGGVVVGMWDAHVEFSKLPNLWLYTWHRDWGVATKPQISNFY
jgi:hypothetical protein